MKYNLRYFSASFNNWFNVVDYEFPLNEAVIEIHKMEKSYPLRKWALFPALENDNGKRLESYS